LLSFFNKLLSFSTFLKTRHRNTGVRKEKTYRDGAVEEDILHILYTIGIAQVTLAGKEVL